MNDEETHDKISRWTIIIFVIYSIIVATWMIYSWLW